jgi:hypothetical protein
VLLIIVADLSASIKAFVQSGARFGVWRSCAATPECSAMAVEAKTLVWIPMEVNAPGSECLLYDLRLTSASTF